MKMKGLFSDALINWDYRRVREISAKSKFGFSSNSLRSGPPVFSITCGCAADCSRQFVSLFVPQLPPRTPVGKSIECLALRFNAPVRVVRQHLRRDVPSNLSDDAVVGLRLCQLGDGVVSQVVKSETVERAPASARRNPSGW